jgi:hypothetical protein
MLKKTIAATGIFAAIGGGIITSIPASAQVPAKDGHTYRDSSSHSRRTTFRQYHRNRNSNWNAEDAINRIRLPLNSTNTLTPTVNVSPVAVPQVVQAPVT